MATRTIEMRAVVDPALKELACDALKEADISVSDYLRSALVHIAETGKVPFDIQRAVIGRRGSVEYKPRVKAE